MKVLKIWGWILLAAAAVLWGCGWISGEFSGHGIAGMDNVDLLLTICAFVCILLATTVLVIVQALKQPPNHK